MICVSYTALQQQAGRNGEYVATQPSQPSQPSDPGRCRVSAIPVSTQRGVDVGSWVE